MLDKLFGGTVGVLHASLTGLGHRQRALAENVANADTPHYKRFEVSYEAQLQAAVEGGPQAPLAMTHPGHLSLGPQSLTQFRPELRRAEDSTLRNDGNNVDIDVEMTRLAQTNVTYNAVAELMKRKMTGLKEVIRGQ
ncbi:Flagellar basal body rod protein FlgB [compost metagenome]